MATKRPTTKPRHHELYIAMMGSVPGIEVKGATMPYTSVNGNMFSFLKEEGMALRLSEETREEFIKKFKTGLFETFGTVMKEYVAVPFPLLKDPKGLKPYIKKSYDYALTLKAKPPKKK